MKVEELPKGIWTIAKDEKGNLYTFEVSSKEKYYFAYIDGKPCFTTEEPKNESNKH